MTDFRPEAILAVLHRHDVAFVVIGGLAATLHGSPHVTFDIDIVPAATASNMEKLSAALTELDARVRVEGIPGGLPFSHDSASLQAIQTLNLVTKHGDLDIAASPAGLADYAEWEASAAPVVVSNVPVQIAALDDVIRSKEAADRPKDRLALPGLRALRNRKADHGPSAKPRDS